MQFPRQTGKTNSGNYYSVVQDAQNSFHISVCKDSYVSYEHFTEIRSEEELLEKVHIVEKEILESDDPKQHLTSGSI